MRFTKIRRIAIPERNNTQPQRLRWGSMVCTVLFLLPGVALQAQRFQGGIHVGLNLAQIDGDRLAGFNQPGLAAGMQINTVFTPRWEGSVALQFAQQGARRNIHDDPAAAYSRIRLNRVEVPVLVLFNEWKFQLGTGISYSRLINHKAIDSFGDDVSNQVQFRTDGLAAVLSGTVFLTEKTGINLAWQKSLWSLFPKDSAQPRWIGRSLRIQGIFRL